MKFHVSGEVHSREHTHYGELLQPQLGKGRKIFFGANIPAMENRLKTLRKARRLTQDEAAEAMGVSKGQYIKLERGERRLTADYISLAARAFHVPQSEVIEAAPESSFDRILAEFAAQYGDDEAELAREELKRRLDERASMIDRLRHPR